MKAATKPATSKAAPRAKDREEATSRPRRRWFRVFLRWSAVAFIWGGLAFAGLIGWYVLDLPDPAELINDRAPSVTVLGADGQVIATYGELHGEVLHFEDLPETLIWAVTATEDRRYFEHIGVDIRGIARAAWVNIQAGGVLQGGSTITQQVAKNLFLTPERSFKRKAQEALLALWLERRFTKGEILAIYLNRVYLGAGTYGVDAAAKRYFDKSARDLTLPEAAMIAGLFKAPSRYNPAADPAAARIRSAEVIDNMVEAGLIDEETARAAKAAPLNLVGERPAGGDARYAADWTVTRAADYIGVARQDLVIVTTIDPDLQRAAQEALQAGLDDEGDAREGAIVSMAPDGAVLAMVGGSDYSTTQFNRVVQAERQPGSAFKLFVYLAALEAGYEPSDIVDDRAIAIDGWSPVNYDGEFDGPMTLTEAFAASTNTVAAEVAWTVGMNDVIDAAHRLGIDQEMMAVPSLALGTTDVTPLELTAAYATIANQGLAARPYVISEIRTRSGDLLYRRDDVSLARLVKPEVQAGLAAMLETTIVSGTGRAAQIPWPAGGKTGTSQDHRDAWFVGFTRQVVTGVWVGNDDGSAMDRVTGGGLPARIWADYMMEAQRGHAALALVDPYDDAPLEYVQKEKAEDSYGSLLGGLLDELGGAGAADPDTRRSGGGDR
ncbi:MAG: PBP1A family penicillin-binding protein [Rhodospirillales bacterium]|nr:PBP1A family penicillin-binding protein [Rhodospirillales bacterium]